MLELDDLELDEVVTLLDEGGVEVDREWLVSECVVIDWLE